jgi:alkanesulfonate monooxygenase SsuD/methylene tetrahydromethanopterin reductase-like flavin-dependent oxidoreductase (luciferase family)
MPIWVSPERFAEGLAEVRRHAEGREVAAAVMCPALVGEGSRERLAEHLAQRYGLAVKPHLVDRYCIAGSEEECAARIRDYAEAGVEHLVFNIGCAAGDELLDQAQRLASLHTVEVS